MLMLLIMSASLFLMLISSDAFIRHAPPSSFAFRYYAIDDSFRDAFCHMLTPCHFAFFFISLFLIISLYAMLLYAAIIAFFFSRCLIELRGVILLLRR